MRRVEVAIIGAGTAGLSARKEVEKVTSDYVIIDNGALGTTCARVGCMPSKVFIQAANDFHRLNTLQEIGISVKEPQVDTRKLMQYVRSMRDRFVGGVIKGMKPWEQKLIREKACFLDPNTLQVGRDKIFARKTIIATGSRPVWPDPFKQFSHKLVDTDSFFDLQRLPKSIAVFGMGVIGTELGLALSRLGIKTHGFDPTRNFGGLTDTTLQDYASQCFSSEFGITYGRAKIASESDKGLNIECNGEPFQAELGLMSLGRKPNLDGLGLETLDLSLDEHGVPLYDKSTLQLRGMPIYLAGDVNGKRAVLHEAADEGRIAGYNSVAENSQCYKRRSLLLITFSEPNICIVGESRRNLENNGVDFQVGKVSFENQGRSLVMRENKGLCHVYAESNSGRFLGAELIAPKGEHLAHLLAWVLSQKLNVQDILGLPFYHPVVEEGLRTAFRDVAKQIGLKLKGPELLHCEDAPAGS